MDTITLTVTKDEAQMINDALNLQAVRLGEQSKTIGVDCLHPDLYHEMWNRNNTLWCRIYEALNPETEKED